MSCSPFLSVNRKLPILDRDPQYYQKTVLPSWIELSLIDVCNRDCKFCPKSDENIAPNTYNKMDGMKKAYVRLTPEHDALDVGNEIGLL